jgi:hypothetical protein
MAGQINVTAIVNLFLSYIIIFLVKEKIRKLQYIKS